jgi:tight adherence protein C
VLFLISLLCVSLSGFFVTLFLMRASSQDGGVQQRVMCFFPVFIPLYAWINFIARVLYPVMSWKHRDRLKNRLSRAGHVDVPVQIFYATQVLCGAFGFLTVCLLFVYVEADLGVGWLVACLIGGLLSSMLPVRHLHEQSKGHRSEMMLQWPYFIDLLVICLHAGMGFDAALRMTVENLPEGAVKKEWTRYLHDLHTGHSKHEALNAMIERVGLASVSNFVSSLVYSEKYGSGLIRQMQQQSTQLRSEQTIMAEENALKAPVKMLLPLSLCFFPCTFLVVSYPIIKQLLSATN